jgi:hypothetical protein
MKEEPLEQGTKVRVPGHFPATETGVIDKMHLDPYTGAYTYDITMGNGALYKNFSARDFRVVE